jgi:hypothetical protein
MESQCRPCQDRGSRVAAHRMVGKTPMCDTHFRSAMGMPALSIQEEAMAKKNYVTDQATIDATRKDAAAGLSLTQIAEKNSVSWPTAKRYSAKNGRKHAGGAKPAKRGMGTARASRAIIFRSSSRRQEWTPFGAAFCLRRKRSF